MYAEWGGAPAGGVVTGLGRIHERLFMIIANDATVKAGAFFPITAKKVIRAQNIAIENRIPSGAPPLRNGRLLRPLQLSSYGPLSAAVGAS